MKNFVDKFFYPDFDDNFFGYVSKDGYVIINDMEVPSPLQMWQLFCLKCLEWKIIGFQFFFDFQHSQKKCMGLSIFFNCKEFSTIYFCSDFDDNFFGCVLEHSKEKNSWEKKFTRIFFLHTLNVSKTIFIKVRASFFFRRSKMWLLLKEGGGGGVIMPRYLGNYLMRIFWALIAYNG